MSVAGNIRHSSVNDRFTVVSWNVKGLGHVIKRGRVFSHLKTLKLDVIFLQETHIGVTEQRRLRACGNTVYCMLYVCQSTRWRKRTGCSLLGVSILYTSMIYSD